MGLARRIFSVGSIEYPEAVSELYSRRSRRSRSEIAEVIAEVAEEGSEVTEEVSEEVSEFAVMSKMSVKISAHSDR